MYKKKAPPLGKTLFIKYAETNSTLQKQLLKISETGFYAFMFVTV